MLYEHAETYVAPASFSFSGFSSPKFETQDAAIMVKILCLHGQGTSGSIFKSQSGPYLNYVYSQWL